MLYFGATIDARGIGVSTPKSTSVDGVSSAARAFGAVRTLLLAGRCGKMRPSVSAQASRYAPGAQGLDRSAARCPQINWSR
jgi:hypothetical protein